MSRLLRFRGEVHGGHDGIHRARAPYRRGGEKRQRTCALKVYEGFELSGCARIDMLLDRETPEVIDINTSPGHDGDFPCAEGVGTSRQDLR